MPFPIPHPSPNMANTPPQPTDFEFEILQELWSGGPQTVRQLHERLNSRRPMVYTTVLKALQVMLEKKLVDRDDSERSHTYRAAVVERAVKDKMVREMIDTAFGGSAAELALRALAMRRANPDELRKLQELLDRMEDRSSNDRGRA